MISDKAHLQPFSVGGQAVIEGVMIRSPIRISTAVRRKNGEIAVKNEDYIPLFRRYMLLSLPILRGFISFFEMLVIGIKSLNFSAEIAMNDVQEKPWPQKRSNTLILVGTLVLALVLGLAVFFFTPILLTTFMGLRKNVVEFNLVAGAIRIALFLTYLWAISQFGELKKVFQYHGAEHKSIFAYEAGEELTEECASQYDTRHPRCGTSFLLVVVLLAVLIFAFADVIFSVMVGHPPGLFQRLALHFALLPFIAGVSYELVKLSGKLMKRGVVRVLIAPGLWLQRITTREPSRAQLEVALVALREALK